MKQYNNEMARNRVITLRYVNAMLRYVNSMLLDVNAIFLIFLRASKSISPQLYYIWNVKYMYKKNWCTVTVAPAIEHHGGHSRTPANPRWDQVPGRSQRLLLGCQTCHECPRYNERVYMEAWHWMWTDTYIGSVTATTHQEKGHNNTWVEPLAGNCTTSSTWQR